MSNTSDAMKRWHARRRAVRIFGAVLALIGIVCGLVVTIDLLSYGEGFEASELERIDEMNSEYSVSYGYGDSTVGSTPPPDQVAKDVKLLLVVGRATHEMSSLLPLFKPHEYDEIQKRLEVLKRRSPVKNDDVEAVEAIRDLSRDVHYAHYSATGVLLAHLMMMGALLVGGLLSIAYWGRSGAALIVLAGLSPTIWYDPGSKIVAYIGFMLIGAALFFVAPGRKPDGRSGGVGGWLESAANPRQAGMRLVTLGAGAVLYSVVISGVSIALAGEIGAASAPVAVGGVAYGIMMIVNGLRIAARG